MQQKVYSLSSGSWNIQEEIRRVRSKATEDMLKTSARIDLPSYAWERKSLDEPLLADKKDWEGGAKVHNFDLFPATGSISASLELAAGAITSRGLPGQNKFVGNQRCFTSRSCNLLSFLIRHP